MTVLPTVSQVTQPTNASTATQSNVAATHDVESGAEHAIDLGDIDVVDASERYVGRGPCNRFERGLCRVGKQFGVLVVFE